MDTKNSCKKILNLTHQDVNVIIRAPFEKVSLSTNFITVPETLGPSPHRGIFHEPGFFT